MSFNAETDMGRHNIQTQSKGVGKLLHLQSMLCSLVAATLIDLQSSQPRLHELCILKREHSMIKVIQTVARKWKELATALQLRPNVIEEITEDISEEDQACEAVFRQWLSGRHRVPVNWSTVVECLSECGFQDLAQDVAKVLNL